MKVSSEHRIAFIKSYFKDHAGEIVFWLAVILAAFMIPYWLRSGHV